jgi:3-oxoacyl-[acyl-carrier protein] reductase
VTSRFGTTSAAARHMVRRESGVILVFGGTGPPPRNYYIGGTQVALGSIDLMRRQLAAELGPHGIRVVTMRTGGVPESIPEKSVRAEIERMITADTMLGRAATLEDVGNVAAFLASDRARTMTAATANISCGALVD